MGVEGGHKSDLPSRVDQNRGDKAGAWPAQGMPQVNFSTVMTGSGGPAKLLGRGQQTFPVIAVRIGLASRGRDGDGAVASGKEGRPQRDVLRPVEKMVSHAFVYDGLFEIDHRLALAQGDFAPEA